ncbi:MAG: hypothetical protein V3U96_08485 [Paracoccaceae bacterium]
MNIAERVNHHISKTSPKVICDGCIALALGLRHQQANRVTMALATTGEYTRRKGICDICSKERTVIWRV